MQPTNPTPSAHTFPVPHHDEACTKCGGFEGEPCEPPKGNGKELWEKHNMQTCGDGHSRSPALDVEGIRKIDQMLFELGVDSGRELDTDEIRKFINNLVEENQRLKEAMEVAKEALEGYKKYEEEEYGHRISPAQEALEQLSTYKSND